MDVIVDFYKSILPVIAFIPVGFFLRKKFNLSPNYVSKALLYFLLPLVVIDNVAQADPSKILIITAISFILALCMNLPALILHRNLAKKEDLNFLKSTFSFFNVAFFGTPVVIGLFGQEAVSILFCVYLGTALYGDIIAYFQVARTKLSVKEALFKVLKTPYIYTFIVAIGLKIAGFKVPEEAESVMDTAGWIVSAAGMLIVGLSLKRLKPPDFDFSLISKLLGIRIVAAVVILGLILLTEFLLIKQLENKDYQILALLPFLPISSNLSLFAAFIETEEEKFSITVLLSIVASLILVPLVALFF